MNAAAMAPGRACAAASPHARRLARARMVEPGKVVGSGPDGRIVAADIPGQRPPVADTPSGPMQVAPGAPVIAFSAAEPAEAPLLVLHAARVMPVTLPLLPDRLIRLVLVVDRDRHHGRALLCADGASVTGPRAAAVLAAFAVALEQPLSLLV